MTTNDLVRTDRADRPGKLTENDVEVLRAQVARGCTNEEMRFFLAVCNRTGLDPFSRQIYAIKYERQPMIIHVGIDGLRLIAERSGLWEGTVGPLFCGKEETWRDVWLRPEKPMAAKVGVYKRGFREPVWATAYMDTCYKANSPLWKAAPREMLEKCAEAVALRRAFPNETQGVRAAPELTHEDYSVNVQAGEVLTEAQADRIAVEEVTAHRAQRVPPRGADLARAERPGYAAAVIDVPAYPGFADARCETCHKPLTAGQWLFSHKAKGRPLCPTCQKAAPQAAAEDVVGVASDELEMEVDPGGGTAVEDQEGEIPPAFR